MILSENRFPLFGIMRWSPIPQNRNHHMLSTSRASSDMRLGSQGGSHTTSTLASRTPATLATAFSAVDLWIAETPAGGTTNIVVAAWPSPEHALRPPQITVDATVMDAGDAVRTQRVTWRRFDLDAARARWPRACAAILTDDWAPVDRLLAGRASCVSKDPLR